MKRCCEDGNELCVHKAESVCPVERLLASEELLCYVKLIMVNI